MTNQRDHGGGLDAAVARFGGTRADWLDLSTGINPQPYPLPDLPPDAWTALPDKGAFDLLYARARSFWHVPDGAGILAATGASPIIAAMPRALPKGTVYIPGPTYNEHGAAFVNEGWGLDNEPTHAMVVVNPNNPDGHIWRAKDVHARYTIIDESFADVAPDQSLMTLATRENTVILKSFGKFWGLAGLRLGFAIGDPALIARLADLVGPWQVSGPALAIGADALADPYWADATRTRLQHDATRLDRLMMRRNAKLIGGTTLFRLYEVDDAKALQTHLAKGRIWSRTFPYNPRWLRLGLPAAGRWDQLENAL